MIKRMSIIVRKPGLDDEAFREAWLRHGELAKSMPGVRRYVQNHIVDRAQRGVHPRGDQQVDGFVEFWFDSVADLEAAFASPEGQALQADGRTFLSAVTTFLVEERPIVGWR
jgi:uncharacterized protein (TIGR02118 family)